MNQRRVGAGVCRGIQAALVLWLAGASGLAGQADTAHGPFLGTVRPELKRLITDHRGVVGLSVMDPNTGDMYSVNGDESFPSASIVKLAVMVDVYARVVEGQLRLNDPLTFLAIDRTGGSGVLQFMDAPLQITVWDAVFLMITLSDNTATNLLLAKLPPHAVTERMHKLGLPRTRIFVRVNADPDDSFAPDSARAYGLGMTTPNEIASLLTMLYRRELVSPEASDAMMAVLRHQFYKEGLPRHLPPGVEVAHKTGSLAAARNDCGVVYGPVRPFVICVLTKDNEDRRWTRDNAAERLIGNVTRVVYDALNPPATTTNGPD
ncbi:MAG: class A beta-lactamase-related serine hydrolase [Gemmatimonadota bacterium]